MLIYRKTELLKTIIRNETGADVQVHSDESGSRGGLRVHFSGWTRQEGPVFSLRPSGLNRHIIDFHFGTYAKPCIQQINDNITQERFSVARALINRLNEIFEVKISPLDEFGNWKICSNLDIKITIRGIESIHSDFAIERSATLAMVPLIGAIAELIGEDDIDLDVIGDEEGQIKEMVTIRRERSRRNRLLCLSIHGRKCKICGFDPISFYGSDKYNIIEVHHIEPLSETSKPHVYDPSVDLIPLCANCHRAIHSQIPALTPEELIAKIGKN